MCFVWFLHQNYSSETILTLEEVGKTVVEFHFLDLKWSTLLETTFLLFSKVNLCDFTWAEWPKDPLWSWRAFLWTLCGNIWSTDSTPQLNEPFGKSTLFCISSSVFLAEMDLKKTGMTTFPSCFMKLQNISCYWRAWLFMFCVWFYRQWHFFYWTRLFNAFWRCVMSIIFQNVDLLEKVLLWDLFQFQLSPNEQIQHSQNTLGLTRSLLVCLLKN